MFPPFRLSAMVWVALVPMMVALWSLGGKRAGWKGFGLGWLAGTVSCAIQFQWLAVVSPLGAALMPIKPEPSPLLEPSSAARIARSVNG